MSETQNLHANKQPLALYHARRANKWGYFEEKLELHRRSSVGREADFFTQRVRLGTEEFEDKHFCLTRGYEILVAGFRKEFEVQGVLKI